MFIFLYGQDTYRSRRKLKEIIERYKKIHQSGLDLKFLDLNKRKFEDFKNEVQTVSMFADKKLIILEEAFVNQEFKEGFLKNFKKLTDSKDTIVFFETKQILKSDSLFKFLKKYAQSQEFEFLEGRNLKNWAKKEFTGYQTEIAPEALDKLIDFVGSDLWQLSNEIKKLASYKIKGKIRLEDVELLIRPKIEPEIFKTIDAIASKNKKQALELIHKHLEKGNNPLYLLSMINFQFRNLLIVKDLVEKYQSPYAISKIANLHPYIVKKSCPLSQKFKTDELKKIYQKIFQADLDIKTGKLLPQTALDLLITEI